MGAKTAISIEEYLRTSFPDLDKEYRDGELVERSLPDYSHSRTQSRLSSFFESRESYYPATELRLQVRKGLYLIPDVSVFHPEEPAEEVPSTPPFIAIEILSPDDSLNKLRAKLDEYKAWGVKHVWAVDPHARIMYSCEPGFTEVTSLRVPELNLELTPKDVFGG